MVVVTGGAGFIGSNLVRALNARGVANILVVDDLTDGRKIANLAGTKFADYLDKSRFADLVRSNAIGHVDMIFHQGACSATTEWDGKFLMENNYEFSKELFHFCQDVGAPLIYASSASVYGLGASGFEEVESCERPLNAYAFSKLAFDNYVFRSGKKLVSQVVGLRYFNVYGPGEDFKDGMASPVFAFHKQLAETNEVKVFGASHGYEAGEHLRDFVYVDDCVSVNLWFSENPQSSGIFNVGTGRASSFNEVATNAIKNKGDGSVRYIDFPSHLREHYQSYTCADLTKLRSVGYQGDFLTIQEGMELYTKSLQSKSKYLA